MPEVVESASQTGEVEKASQPSATPDTSPHTLQAPFERHLLLLLLEGHFPNSVPSPAVIPSVITSLNHITYYPMTY